MVSKTAVVLLVGLVWCSLARRQIQCRSSCYDKYESVPVNGLYLTCDVRAISGPPTVEIKNIPAESPHSLHVDWYFYKEKSIALNITWEQKEASFATEKNSGDCSGCTRGFYFYIRKISSEVTVHYLVNISLKDQHDKTKVIEGKIDGRIAFNFACYGRAGSVVLKPGMKLKVQLHAIPLRKRTYREQDITKSIKILRRKLLATSSANSKEPTAEKSNTEEQKPTSTLSKSYSVHSSSDKRSIKTQNSTIMAENEPHAESRFIPTLLAGIAIFVFVFLELVILIVVKRKPDSNERDGQRKCSAGAKLLLICDVTESEATRRSHKLAANLADTFKQHRLSCNWDHCNEIGRNALSWYQRHIDDTDIVLFLLLQNYEDFENHLNHSEQCGESQIDFAKNYFLKSWKSADKDCVLLLDHGSKGIPVFQVNNLKAFLFKDSYERCDDFYKYLENYRRRTCSPACI